MMPSCTRRATSTCSQRELKQTAERGDVPAPAFEAVTVVFDEQFVVRGVLSASLLGLADDQHGTHEGGLGARSSFGFRERYSARTKFPDSVTS